MWKRGMKFVDNVQKVALLVIISSFTFKILFDILSLIYPFYSCIVHAGTVVRRFKVLDEWNRSYESTRFREMWDWICTGFQKHQTLSH